MSYRILGGTSLAIGIVGLVFYSILLWASWGAARLADVMSSGHQDQRTFSQNDGSNRQLESRSSDLERASQAGDAFGGFNAAVGVLTLMLVGLAGILQWKQLRDARRALAHERTEAMVFRLLDLGQHAASDVQGTFLQDGKDMVRVGNAALASYAARVSLRAERSHVDTLPPAELKIAEKASALTLQRLVAAYHRHAYRASPSTLGPYFRLLYHTFRTISDAEVTDEVKENFVKVASARLPEGVVFLMALHSLTQRGLDFVPLIERMGLLEHLHPKYRKRYEPSLRLVYRAAAFRFNGWHSGMGTAPRVDPKVLARQFH